MLRAMVDDRRWLEDYLARVRAIRWLEPDAEMDTLGEGARTWIAERVEEHTVALSLLHALEPVTLAWRAERMLDRARVESGHVSYAGDVVEFSLAALAWIALLDDARQVALRNAKEALGAARRTEVVEAVWEVLRAPAAHMRKEAWAQRSRSERWDGGGEVRNADDYAVGATGGAALVYHALWELSAKDGEPSPWAPLIALWERGVCTLAALDGAMIVYVPLRDKKGLVCSPDVKRDEAYFSGGIGGASFFRSYDAPLLGDVARAALKRFNAHGLGPLPGMYRPVNISDVVMATNWPGPPDLYIFPPPAHVDEAALDKAADRHIREVFRGAPGAPAPPDLPDAPPPWYARFREWFKK
jgi:hypothetical protein